MKRLHIVIISLISLIFISSIDAQFFRYSHQGKEETYFSIDHALFKSEKVDKTARLEIYYQILNAALNFEKIDGAFEAEYEITIELYKDKKRYDSYKHSQIVRVESENKTLSKVDYRTNQVNFYVDKGKYEIIIKLFDPVHSKEITEKFKVKVDDYKHKYTLISDIELVQAIAPIRETSSVFDKGKLQLIPSVRHKFGVSDNASLYFYLELYQGTNNLEEIRVETVLRHHTKGMLYRDSLTSFFDSPTIRQFRELSIDELRPGQYELIITLRGHRNKKILTKYKDFEILWTPKSMIKYDYDVMVKQISLIASNEELELLEDKETYEERLKAITEYWNSKDPTPGTYENEVKNAFYSRVAIANHNFSTVYGNGWRTDRGRIYIMYGQPDQVDDYPIVPDRRPYQEWHYYQNTKYLRFVFVDVSEDGDYKLVYPYDGLYRRPGN